MELDDLKKAWSQYSEQQAAKSKVLFMTKGSGKGKVVLSLAAVNGSAVGNLLLTSKWFLNHLPANALFSALF